MKKTEYISMKKAIIELNFFFFIENKNTYKMKKKSTSYLQQFWSYVQKTDQNYPKIQEIWQHADIPIFPPGARTYQNHFLSPIHLLNKIQQFSFALNAPFSMPININNSRQHSPDRYLMVNMDKNAPIGCPANLTQGKGTCSLPVHNTRTTIM